MFNSFHEEDMNVSKPRPEQSYKPDSQRFSEREDMNFSHASSRRQRPSSQSNFSKDLNSECSETFMFVGGRIDSHDKLHQASFAGMGMGAEARPGQLALHEPGSSLFPQSVLNRLDVNSLSKSQNTSKHKLSDMLGSGRDANKVRQNEKDPRKGPKNAEAPRLGKRGHNRTSIFQTRGREPEAKRHVDFLSGNPNFPFHANGRIRKTEVTRMVSLLGDSLPNPPAPNFCRSIQRNQRDEDLGGEWVRHSDDKPDIRSFNKMWSGLNSLQNHNEDVQPFGSNSMLAFEKDAPKPEYQHAKLKRHLFSNQYSEDSRSSLPSELDSSLTELARGGPRKFPFFRSRRPGASKANLPEAFSEENGFLNLPLRGHIPEVEGESESSRPSKRVKTSEGESMYFSELNDSSSKDRLLLKVLLENSGKKVNINTLNTNFNTVNNNNNNLNYIAGGVESRNPGQGKESQFITYLNNIKNYYVDPLSKAIFLKIGAEEEKEEVAEKAGEDQKGQLIPLTTFMTSNAHLQGTKPQANSLKGKTHAFGLNYLEHLWSSSPNRKSRRKSSTWETSCRTRTTSTRSS